MTPSARDELGAHVSVRGGTDRAPGRAAELASVVLQMFTKVPNRWADPTISDSHAESFAEARREHGIDIVAAHDSYLINLASPDETLWRRSVESFTSELARCRAYGVDLLVTHPGNATDHDPDRGIEYNARGLELALEAESGETSVLLEITAGSGSSIGATFENLARIIEGVSEDHRDRIGVCFDTCHAWAAGYDLVEGWDDLLDEFDEVIGLERLRLFHMNDSRNPQGSRKDRHAGIGEGTLGLEPFRQIMNDARLRTIPKVLETPKGKQGNDLDLRNLATLRGLRE
ncbi:MAG: deoxyribonuclease IV [Longimicrobiales bacterium]|nr:deoxyribonuclease IV [Longimicrobiales bacterium]